LYSAVVFVVHHWHFITWWGRRDEFRI